MYIQNEAVFSHEKFVEEYIEIMYTVMRCTVD